ncbi:Zn(II)2Cys6 transcription factor domain-containing protein [Aspergillus ibericus CBS 121593]|uniref:C6 zinc finger domain protein n=1 Tax=Aspergillus ibericus CBS 121593 TaxID=1448316 RepID=A0A395GRF4_9EURO|nr:C6 zinc finger domain protein [Aspergillus ibericus CBS 121593]RAK97952.1 C6 zinc finger domain protein [Aspergillus ibericus CBS 121593]
MPRKLSTTAPEKRRKSNGTRSRTGCRTCRVRRIKCDETPGKCNNCTSTGRSCAYDMHRLPRAAAGQGLDNKIICQVADGFRWAMTSDERRCFSHFQHFTIPSLLELFDSALWRNLVLQISYSEPAVYHAAVALSAIHQDVEQWGMPLPGQTRQNVWQKFALEQSARSYGILSKRNASDPRLREIMLLCCLLYSLLELLQGQYERACRHLQGGLRILKEIKVQKQLADDTESPVEKCLVAAFVQLDIQSTYYGVHGPVLCVDTELGKYQWQLNQPEMFSTLLEARQAIEPLVSGVFRFTSESWPLSAADVARDYDSLLPRQERLLSQLNLYADLFSPFYFGSYAGLSYREQRGADIIYILHRCLTLSVKTCLLAKDPAVLDCYTPEYQEALYLVEALLYKYPERPTFTLDVGILPTLYLISFKCYDVRVRLRAIEALQHWPHREGLFESKWMSFLLLEFIKADMKKDVLSMPEFPSESSSSSTGSPGATADQYMSTVGYIEEVQKQIMSGASFHLHDALESVEYLTSWSCVKTITPKGEKCK